MHGSGSRTTCGKRVTDVIKASAQGHKLGIRFIWQVKDGGTCGELVGT